MPVVNLVNYLKTGIEAKGLSCLSIVEWVLICPNNRTLGSVVTKLFQVRCSHLVHQKVPCSKAAFIANF